MRMCPGGENAPEIGPIIQIRVKAPVRFNGLDIFEIEAAAEMASGAPSRILSAITHAALPVMLPKVDNNICDTVRVQIM